MKEHYSCALCRRLLDRAPQIFARRAGISMHQTFAVAGKNGFSDECRQTVHTLALAPQRIAHILLSVSAERMGFQDSMYV